MIEEKPRVPNRYRLVDPDGKPYGEFLSAEMAAQTAALMWPGIEQRDFENGRNGWDIEVVR